MTAKSAPSKLPHPAKLNFLSVELLWRKCKSLSLSWGISLYFLMAFAPRRKVAHFCQLCAFLQHGGHGLLLLRLVPPDPIDGMDVTFEGFRAMDCDNVIR